MAQATITNFFVSRKRAAADDLKGKSKIMALDSDSIHAGYGRSKASENAEKPAARIKVEATVILASDAAIKLRPQDAAAPATPASAPRAKTPARTRRATGATKPRDSKQADMKSFLQGHSAAKGAPETTSLPPAAQPVAPSPASTEVKQEASDACGAAETRHDEVAPASAEEEAAIKEEPGVAEDQGTTAAGPAASAVKVEVVVDAAEAQAALNSHDAVKAPVGNSKEAAQPTRKESNVEKARRELSLGDIKSRLTRSARLAELKASLARFDEGRDKLSRIEQAKKKLDNCDASKPQLAVFNRIELEVPVSPAKSPMKSPMKSPQKCLAGSRSPAFHRYSTLVQPGTPALSLPPDYRHLAELFRCVDTVVSMMYNRKETIAFRKLQPAVQEMSRRLFTKSHLAQMVTVYPGAYTLRQEKYHDVGTNSNHEKYDLVLAPVIVSNSDGGNSGVTSMIPSMLLERKRCFYNNLLQIVKNHHQEFLQSLDPPIEVAMEALTRWHPEFALDQVPDVLAAPLPQPPNLEKCCSAKDVLAKARQLYSCNSRMEKALESVAQANASVQVPTVNVEVVNPPASAHPPTSPFKSMQLSAALKGIPKALIEKIRARQAAKAMEAMTRTSAQDKEAAQFARLPEIARILRNVFVAEKKGALPLETVLEKVGNSYRSAMSQRELEEHIRLLAKTVPGWLTFEHLLKTDYLRLSKKGDMNRVMNRLNDLASSKQGTTSH